MEPTQLADEMEATIEKVEHSAILFSTTVNVIASGRLDPNDGLRAIEHVLDLRDVARTALASFAGVRSTVEHVALVKVGFRLALARLEMEASEVIYLTATGQDIDTEGQREKLNEAIMAVASRRIDLNDLRRAPGQA